MKIGIDLGGSHIGVGVIDNKNFIVEKVEKRLLAKEKKDIKSIIESYIIKNVKDKATLTFRLSVALSFCFPTTA